MKTGTLLKRWGVVLCAILLTIVLFAIPAFAEEVTTGADNTETDTTEVGTEAETEASTEAETEAETQAPTSSGSNSANNTEDKGKKIGNIITLIVAGVVIIVLAVLGIKYREKVGKFLRVYKSESKKIVWLPWDQTKKSTLVVLVVLIVCAVAICLLDFALSKGYLAFITLFR